MGIDVVNIFRYHTSVFQRYVHYVFSTQSFGVRGCYMMRVGGGSTAGYFAINLSAAAQGMFQFFYHQYAGAFAHNKTIAVFIIRAAGRFRIIVTLAQGFHGIETTYTGFADYTFGATG